MPSSVIRRFRYDAADRRLTVTFTSGAVYAYLDVPPEVAAELEAAESKGRVFGETIRDRYAFDRLRLPD